MAGKSRFAIAEKSIKNYFDQSGTKTYNEQHISDVLSENARVWRLPQYITVTKFIEQLLRKGILQYVEIDFQGYIGKRGIYIVPDASAYNIGASLFPHSYISHYTAMYLNGLTYQIPRVIHVTFEQSLKHNQQNRSPIIQSNIDRAFSKPQRLSSLQGEYSDYRYYAHTGKHTNRLGVYTNQGIPVTNVERTLIDITVRPAYAGGVGEVLKAYEAAKDNISINKLLATLKTLDFIYPYAHAIGFYMQRAQYQDKHLEKLEERLTRYKFYLTYDISDKAYDERWKIYYPKGM